MLKRFLIPITKEGLPELALKRAADLSSRLESRMIISYFIDDSAYDGVGDQIMHVLTEHDKEVFQRSMVRTQEQVARRIIRKNVIDIIGSKPDDFMVKKGPMPDAVMSVIDEKDADTVVMEYGSYDLLKYRIMDRSPVPVWIERHDRPIRKIGLFLSDLYPNERAARAARRLKLALNAKLLVYYIMDPEASAPHEGPEELEGALRMKFKDIVEDDLGRAIPRLVVENQLDLMIMGRMGKRGYFHLRSGFARKRPCSVLLVN